MFDMQCSKRFQRMVEWDMEARDPAGKGCRGNVQVLCPRGVGEGERGVGRGRRGAG